MLCQRCGKSNSNTAETCRTCGYRLLALLPPEAEEPSEAREFLALEEAATARLQALEKQVRHLTDEVDLFVHALEYLERSVTTDRAGIHALVGGLREKGLLDPADFGRLWLERAVRNLAELALKDHFLECRDAVLGAFRGRGLKRFEERLDRAEDLFFLLDSGGALTALEEAAELDPANLPLAAFLGESLTEKGELGRARRHLEPVALSADSPQRAEISWARLLLREGSPPEAAAYLEARIKRGSRDPEIFTHLALCRGLLGEWDLTVQSAERALKVQEAPAALFLLAHGLLRLGKVSQAEAALERLVALDSSCAEALLQQALLHMGRGRWKRARAVLDRLQTLAPQPDPEQVIERFRRTGRGSQKPDRILPLRLEGVLDIMGSARSEARMLLRQAEMEIR